MVDRVQIRRWMARLLPPLVLLAGAGSLPAQDPTVDRSAASALVVPIEGEIDQTMVAMVLRGLRTGEDLGVQRVILEIDTPGGAMQAMEDIAALLDEVGAGGVATVGWVRGDAFSAGAYLALACGETYMARGSSIGAVTPVEMTPFGVQQVADDDVRRKLLSAMRSQMRALVERRGAEDETLLLAEAMVDPTLRVFEVTYTDANDFQKTEVMDAERLAAIEARFEVDAFEQVGSQPLTLTADEAVRWGFSSGTFENLDELMDDLGLRRSDVTRIEPNWSEEVVYWLEGLKPILFVLGFILLVIEAKAPGLFLPGILGAALIGLGLFSSYLVGLAEITEILLFVLGLVAIAVEIFVMPGTLVFGFLGFILVFGSLILSQQSFLWPETDAQFEVFSGNLLNLFFLLLLVVAGVALFSRLMPKVPWVNRVLLAPPDRQTGASTRFAKTGVAENAELLGSEGLALTDLRPAGTMEAGERRLDVVADGGFIPKGAALRIIDVSGNRIVVAPVTAAADESGEASIGLLVFLLLLGLGLVVAEVFFVSMGVLSIGAAVSLVSAVVLAYMDHGPGWGTAFLLMSTVGLVAGLFFGFRYLPRTRIGRVLLLEGADSAEVSKAAEAPGLGEMMGQVGTTQSDLRPSGFAQIAGRRVDVVTRGEMLAAGEPIRVIEVEGNRVVVARDSLPSSDPSE